MKKDRYERKHRATRASTIVRDLMATGPVESKDVSNPFIPADDRRFAPAPSADLQRLSDVVFNYLGTRDADKVAEWITLPRATQKC